MNTEETWEQKWAREEREHTIKAKKAWETKYRHLEPKLKERNRNEKATVYEFDDGVSESETVRVAKGTRFTIYDNGKMTMWKHTTKAQKFLVVSGPLTGKRIVDDHPSYVLYNAAGFNRGAHKNESPPRCVLVHRSSFKVD